MTVGKACELVQIAKLVLHGFMLRSGLGAPAVQLLTAALLFCSVRGDSCLSEWGILRPFSTPAPEKVCCGSSSSESSWRERQTGRSAGSRTFELQALGSIRFLTHPAPGQRVFYFKTGPSNGVRDLAGRDSSLDPQLAQAVGVAKPARGSFLGSGSSGDRLGGLFVSESPVAGKSANHTFYKDYLHNGGFCMGLAAMPDFECAYFVLLLCIFIGFGSGRRRPTLALSVHVGC